MEMDVVLHILAVGVQGRNHSWSDIVLRRLLHGFLNDPISHCRQLLNAIPVIFDQKPKVIWHGKDNMAMIDIEQLLYCFPCPCINIFLAASAAYSTIAAEVPQYMLVTIRTVIVEISLARIIAKKHSIDFFNLLC